MLITVDVSLLWCMFFRFLKCAHSSVGTIENDIGETLIIFATLQLRFPKSNPRNGNPQGINATVASACHY
jgi:hypothetical protein